MSTILPQDMGRSLMPLPLRTSASHQDPLVHVERQAKYIQRNLQHLIDAQSEGLLAGLSSQQPGDSMLNESYAYPSELSASKRVTAKPVHQTAGKKINLRWAREGIFTSMYDLMRLREEEQDILAYRQEETTSGLRDIETFSNKRSGLEKAISSINNDRQTQRSRQLREEASELEAQIHEMENTLAQMKAKHRHAIEELSQIENSVDAKLSSYKSSLALLESDVRKFLANPPVKAPVKGSTQDSFYSLKPSRRTLEMAEEFWKKERSEMQQRQKEVVTEIKALEEGSDVWKQVIKDISGFEKRLRATMRRSIQSQSQLLQEEMPSQVDMIRGVMEDLERTTSLVEQYLSLAEGKNWRLLVCCISAELQALREAREMLLGAFGVTEGDINPTASSLRAQEESSKSLDNDLENDPLGADNVHDHDHELEHSEPPADLLQDISNHSPETTKLDHAHEDDEPDPAWLLPES